MTKLELIPIDQNGKVDSKIQLSALALEMCTANLANYKINGFIAPWNAYLAVQNQNIVGTCAFKSPPSNGRVEIAYFTFPEFQGHGIAKSMAKGLIEIAQKTDPHVQVFAQTLAEKNPSTSVLTRLGFVKTKEFVHPEDGKIWEWELHS